MVTPYDDVICINVISGELIQQKKSIIDFYLFKKHYINDKLILSF